MEIWRQAYVQAKIQNMQAGRLEGKPTMTCNWQKGKTLGRQTRTCRRTGRQGGKRITDMQAVRKAEEQADKHETCSKADRLPKYIKRSSREVCSKRIYTKLAWYVGHLQSVHTHMYRIHISVNWQIKRFNYTHYTLSLSLPDISISDCSDILQIAEKVRIKLMIRVLF